MSFFSSSTTLRKTRQGRSALVVCPPSHSHDTPPHHRITGNSCVYRFLLSPRPYFSTEPRRAAVAIVIRIVPSPTTLPPPDAPIPTLDQFLDLDWVKDPVARPEILFLQRDGGSSSDGLSTLSGEGSTQHGSRTEAHLAFPGGRTEEGDEGGLYTGTICVCSSTVTNRLNTTQPCDKHGRKSVWISQNATLHVSDSLMIGKSQHLSGNVYS